MYHALIWLLAIEVLGLIVFPLTFSLFRRLPDRGIIFSKLLGLLLGSYLLWVLGLAHILPNTQYSILLVLAVVAVASGLVARRNLPEILAFVRRERVPLVTAELVFLGLYFVWLSVVAFSPAINHTEQPMDFAFLNAILKSRFFPPEDPWLAGHSISYYYFGHFMMAFLTKLTSIPSSVSYNLSIALIAALLGAGAYSLAYNMIRLSGATLKAAVLFALAAPVFIVLLGNLEGVVELVHARGWGSEGFWSWLSIKGLESPLSGSSSVFPDGHFWWWRATRVIDTVVDGKSLDYTIHEFPYFSFLLGDLHAHVSSLPFILFNLALGLNLFVSGDRLGFGWLRRNPWEAVIISLALGSLAFINIWDFPVFAAILVSLVLIKAYGGSGLRTARDILESIAALLPILVLAVLMFLPFYLSFSSQASGILPTKNAMDTRPIFFFMIWGLPSVVTGGFLLKQILSVPGLAGRNPGLLSLILIVPVLPFLLWAVIKVLISPFEGGLADGLAEIGSRLGKLLPAMAIVGVALYSMLLRSRSEDDKATTFSLLPLGLAFYLLLGAELFYVSDLFGTRMNTVFKVYYQVWLLLGVVSAYGLYYVCCRPAAFLAALRLPRVFRLPTGLLGKSVSWAWVGLIVLLVAGSLYYPVAAALDRQKNGGGDGFDGLAFLKRGSGVEYDAIVWLRDKAPRGRIVEAVGPSYYGVERGQCCYASISASTGLPTLLGWKGHEEQWRGRQDLFDLREQWVEQIYSSTDPDEVRQLLETNEIRYVYVGRRERAKYGAGQLDEFSFLKPVFPLKPVTPGDGVVIYERLQPSGVEVTQKEDGSAD